jgi:hypothetical protein
MGDETSIDAFLECRNSLEVYTQPLPNMMFNVYDQMEISNARPVVGGVGNERKGGKGGKNAPCLSLHREITITRPSWLSRMQ